MSYLANERAIPLYLPELPLSRGAQRPVQDLEIAGCLADAGPDSWGQRVILARRLGHLTDESDTGDVDRLTYFLESGSDRIGALDFQERSDRYIPRTADHNADLQELMTASERLEDNEPLSPALAEALVRGTSIGGARPKALIDDGEKKLIAKFSRRSDVQPVIKSEAVALELARIVGLDVPASRLIEIAGRDVLLIERFDRMANGGRRLMVTALTMLELRELNGMYATYPEFADVLRARTSDPVATLRELFTRIVFNVAIGNTDDHAKNHSAFWDGQELTLTPGYDLTPQLRSGSEVNQAMAIGRNGERASRFSVCRAAAAEYLLTPQQADEIIDRIEQTINDCWDEAADAAHLSVAQRNGLWHRQILNESVRY